MIAYVIIAVLLIAVILSVPRALGNSATKQTHGEKSVARNDDKRETARRIYEANERVNRRNYAAENRLMAEVERSRRPALDYGSSVPLLGDGEVIDAEVTDVVGLLR